MKGKSTVSADRLCARILKPEAASWLFWASEKATGACRSGGARGGAAGGTRARRPSRSREGDAGERIGSRTHRGHVQNARASRLLDSCASPTATLVLVTEKPSGRACLAGRRTSGEFVRDGRKSRGRTASEAGRGGSSGAPFAVSSARGPVSQSRLGIAISSPGNRRGRARVPHVRTSRGGSRARFDSPRTFWWLNRQWEKPSDEGERRSVRRAVGRRNLRSADRREGPRESFSPNRVARELAEAAPRAFRRRRARTRRARRRERRGVARSGENRRELP